MSTILSRKQNYRAEINFCNCKITSLDQFRNYLEAAIEKKLNRVEIRTSLRIRKKLENMARFIKRESGFLEDEGRQLESASGIGIFGDDEMDGEISEDDDDDEDDEDGGGNISLTFLNTEEINERRQDNAAGHENPGQAALRITCSIKEIRSISLHSNMLKSIHSFQSCFSDQKILISSLSSLNLSSNEIEKIDGLDRLIHLRSLNLASNKASSSHFPEIKMNGDEIRVVRERNLLNPKPNPTQPNNLFPFFLPSD